MRTSSQAWSLLLLTLLCGVFQVSSDEVVTPDFWEHQFISNDDFVTLEAGTRKIDASLGPNGHITALTPMGKDGSAGRYALIKAPGRPVEILLREGDSLATAGLDDTVRKITHVEAGVGGRAVVVADSLGDGRIGYRLILDGGVAGFNLVAVSGQDYQGSTLRLHAGHMLRLSSAGQLAFTGCVRADADACGDQLWFNNLSSNTAIELSGRPLPGIPGAPVVAGTWNPYGFPVNGLGQVLVEALLNDAQDGPKALLLIDGQTVRPVAVEGFQAPGLPAGGAGSWHL